MRQTTIAIAILALSLGACSSSDKTSASNQGDLGTGINTLDRQYARSAPDTWDAAVAAVKHYDLKVETDAHDSMGGEIRAHRGSGDKVVIRVKSLDDKNSDVSVRVEPGNRNMAEMLHEKIADKLGLKEAKSTFFGGNSAEGTYPVSLEAAVKAAEDACGRLNLAVTNKQVTDDAAVIDARETYSIPVQFKMKKVSDGMKVYFIAGREKSDANHDLSRRMKIEFESCCTAKNN
jgi:ABC-type sugar transport system substrate-binding protein